MTKLYMTVTNLKPEATPFALAKESRMMQGTTAGTPVLISYDSVTVPEAAKYLTIGMSVIFMICTFAF
ncbi:hypothetical protein FGO68_gene2877 [Halteria grandinella]|uniref:Uncharacterized protein n=1 Tax=Halteria grandinella TaxID=5974 RepID=A0A8J8NLT5_HALGN|nr:hypothetical protein FGO68_gene2877 [Halteria grandinella]